MGERDGDGGDGDGTEPELEATHGAAARRPPAAAPGELLPLGELSTEQLTRELGRRQQLMRQLAAKRSRLMQQLKQLDARIAQLGQPGVVEHAGTKGRRSESRTPHRRSRARNPVSLPDAIASAVEVRATITPAEAARLVLQNGYTSTSKNFGMMVANALAKDARFRRLTRGVYERVS